MDHAVFVWSQLYECAEVHDADYFTGQNLASLDVGNDVFDDLDCFCDHIFIGTAYGYVAIIGNIDLHAGLFDDLVDDFTLFADNITDLLRINGDLLDLWSVLANFFSRLGDRWLHAGVHNEQSCFTASCNRTFYDRSGQTVDLDIHLDCCDTVSCTGYLKVHIAKEVLQTLDIGQKYEIIIGLASYQTAGDTCYHLLDRHACCH